VIVLDTHAWIWLTSDPARLGKKGARAITRAKRKGVAAISCWELSNLAARGRIELDREPLDWIQDSCRELGLDILPLTPAIAFRATRLGDAFHGDPADRLIAATAIVLSAPLVTRDERLHACPMIETIW
jgi:PIN domain nuclease of toxin-antitoxin system